MALDERVAGSLRRIGLRIRGYEVMIDVVAFAVDDGYLSCASKP